MFILLSIRNTVLVVAFSWIWRLVTLKPKQPRRVCNNKAQFILNLYCSRIQFPINYEIEVRFTNKNLLSVNARPNCRKNKQLILSNDTRLFYNNCFLLKSREMHCMTIDVFQHGLPSVNPFFVFFFPHSLHSAFCDPRVMTTNGERNVENVMLRCNPNQFQARYELWLIISLKGPFHR